MCKLFMFASLLLILSSAALAQGTVIETSFYSQAVGQEKAVKVYLPEGYSDHWWMRYPVIYYLHGAGQLLGHDEFPYLVNSLDQMISSGDIWPVIVVSPDGFTSPYPSGFYTSSVLYGDMEGYMTDDLVTWMDENYRTIPWKRKRAVMGHSMGGYGAIMYYGKHPDLFCAAAGVCGTGLDLPSMVSINIYGILAELTGPPYYYDPTAGFANAVLFSMAGAFSPNLSNPPYYVDIPLDENGELIPEVWDLWLEHNLPVYLGWLGTDCWWNRTTIYFDAGTEDQFYIVPASNAFAANLDAMGINYEYQVFTGGHFDKLNERFPIALEFLCSAMRNRWGWWWDSEPEFCQMENSDSAIGFHCSEVAPGGGEPSVSFQLEAPANVSLVIYDAAGRVVGTPCEGPLDPGCHRVDLNRMDLSTGVYFYSITAGNDFATGKILMVE